MAIRNILPSTARAPKIIFGSYNFENSKTKQYQEFSNSVCRIAPGDTPGWSLQSRSRRLVVIPLGTSWTQSGLKKTCGLPYRILAGGTIGVIILQKSDISSVVFWYQLEPHAQISKTAIQKMILKFLNGDNIAVSLMMQKVM